MAAFNSLTDGGAIDLFAQRFDDNGSPRNGVQRINVDDDGRHRLAAASGKVRVAWAPDRIAFAWSGRTHDDKHAAVLTVVTPQAVSWQLQSAPFDAACTLPTDGQAMAQPDQRVRLDQRVRVPMARPDRRVLMVLMAPRDRQARTAPMAQPDQRV